MRFSIRYAYILVASSWWCCNTQVWAADVLVPAASITTNSGRVFVISIGIDSYADGFWPTLRWAAADARRVGERFARGAAEEVARFVLINDVANVRNIRATLASVAAQATRADTVILYVSSHGTLAQTPSGDLERVIVSHDTRQDALLATGLGQSELNIWLDNVAARKKLMMFATCHSGEGKSRLSDSVRALLGTPKGSLVSLADVSEGALILAAAAKNETALEDDRLQGDVYTHFVLEALDTHDRNKDGVVSALEAHDYARDRTWHYTQGRQRPTANARFVGVFSDVVTGDAERFMESSATYSLGGSIQRRVWSDVWVVARAGWRRGEWVFTRIGDLSGNAYWLTVGVDYRFGGRARTL